jgi:mannosyltransferase OCH1-like enzyme
MTAIPRIIHQLWTPVGSMPLEIGEMMGTWQELHPDWDYRFWTEANLPTLANQDLWDRASEVSPEAPEQFRSDVARYEILYHHGGVWVDADFWCQRPLDPLLEDRAFFAGRETYRWLNNALIGAVPGHPVMAELSAGLPRSVSRHPVTRGNTHRSGPQYFTPIARRHQVHEYPQDYFYPYLWTQLDRSSEPFPDAYAVHTWNHRRSMASS